jgi:hypothetical protein
MVSRPPDPMAELQNAFSILFKNWVLAVPPAIVSLLGGLFFILVIGAMIASALGASYMAGYAPPGQGPAATKGLIGLLAAGGLTAIVGIIVLALLSLLAQAVVMGGAERVWHGEPADLAHGVGKGLSKLPPLILLFIVAIIVFFICAVIILIGWIAGIVLAFLFMYTVPAIVVGNEGVMQALGTSYRLVTKNFGPSALAFLGIVVVGIIGAVINRIFLGIHVLGPVLGLLVSFVVGGLTSAYAALVLVRFYDLLRGAAVSTAPAVTPGPTA